MVTLLRDHEVTQQVMLFTKGQHYLLMSFETVDGLLLGTHTHITPQELGTTLQRMDELVLEWSRATNHEVVLERSATTTS
jgi:hypothetical protein